MKIIWEDIIMRPYWNRFLIAEGRCVRAVKGFWHDEKAREEFIYLLKCSAFVFIGVPLYVLAMAIICWAFVGRGCQ